MHRRDFLTAAAAVPLASAIASDVATPAGRVEHVIMLWLGGGASQADTFDPKRVSPDNKQPGSDYAAIPTAAAGVEVCEHLPRTAGVLDRATILRGVHHGVIDEHAAAAYRMHTGRPVSGSVKYASLASIVSHMKGPGDDVMPPYVLMGGRSAGRGPGFLGAEVGPLQITSTTAGPRGLVRPKRISDARHERRAALLAERQREYVAAVGEDRRVVASVGLQDAGFRMAGPQFLSAFDLSREPSSLRQSYGDEFGQRCLLARRLVERGCRFVEVASDLTFQNGTGWDTHRKIGQDNQVHLVRGLDDAFASLIADLEDKRLLDKTLVLISTEFGRPLKFDGMGGRGHQGSVFSCVLAGGGLSHRGAFGASDEDCKTPVAGAVSVPDLFATVLAACGCDPHEELYDGDRPVPATDGGTPVAELFA